MIALIPMPDNRTLPIQTETQLDQSSREMSCFYVVHFWLSPSRWPHSAALAMRQRAGRHSRCRRPTSRTARGWRQKRRQQQGQSELRRREHLAGAGLGQPARRHQELCAVDVRSGRPSARRRQPLGGLWHSGVRHRLCRGRGLQGQRQICRRHQHAESSPIYFGPCTPPGAPHHYTFTLIATDLEPAALAPGLTREELIKALDGHAKGATGLIGTFSKP